MTARLITAPAALAVTLADAKLALKIENSDTSQDTLVEAWLRGVIDWTENYIGRALITQTWRVTLDGFPDAIKLPRPPVSSVSWVKYYDEDGVQQTLDPADYVADTVSEPGYVVPAPDVTWPTTQSDAINTVSVQYVCGYGASDTSVPAAVKNFILAKLVQQYDPAIRPESNTVQASFIDRLLDGYVVFDK